MRVALDANILAYAGGQGDDALCSAALQLIEQLPVASVVLSAQLLGELTGVPPSVLRR